LVYLEQYFKHIGRKFSLQYKENDNTYELNNATLESINNDELTFKTNKSTIKLKFSQIIKAQTIITF
jgi:ribosome maturation factor RimP